MTSRTKQIKLIQILLLIVSLLIIFYTYFDNQIKEEFIISSTDKKRIKTNNTSGANDIFYNIKYSGIDLSGNRYVLTSKEALVDKNSQEIVNMNYVNAIFYFKDNTKLIIDSEKGLYNNKTLDMIFEKNVVATYEGSELFGEKIIYLNEEKTLEVSNNVRLVDVKGNISADKLLFDLQTKKLDISSYKNKINTNINLR
tara:strand:+ start:1264 stop:1857 length:594 start_codon:yes stop_codon:yes gene_type:complete